MSKNTSPQSRSTSGPRSSARGRGKVKAASPSAARVAKTVGEESKARRATGPVTWGSRLRRMFFVVAVPNLVAFFSLVVIALATVLLTTSPSAWLPTAIAESWMVTNLAPVVAGGITISALPILPALILGWMLAGNVHRAIKDKVSINDLLALLGWVIVVPVILIGIAWFMLWDAAQVYDLSPPPLGPTIARALVLHLTALVIGMGPRLWRALAKRYKVSRAVVDGVVLAVQSLLVLLVVAAVVLLALFIFNFDNQALVMDSYPHLAGLGLFSVIGLSLLYLPNILIAAVGVLLGSEFHIGDASVSLFSVHLVPLPPLPLLGVVPGTAAPWAIGLLALTAIAIAFVGVKKKPNFLQAAVSGVAAGVLVLIFGYFVSGDLGYYQVVGPMLLMSAGLAVVWVAGINLAVAAGFAINARRNAEPAAAAATDTSAEAAESEDSAEGADSADISDAQDGAGASEEQADNNAMLDAETDEDDSEQEDSDSAAAAANADDDYIDGEVEESDGNEDAAVGLHESTDPHESELSDTLMDNLEDGAFPDSVPGEDDVEERFDAAGDSDAAEATTSLEEEDSIEDVPSETENFDGELLESEAQEGEVIEHNDIEHRDDESVADADAEAEDSDEQSKKNNSN
ncbi:cell division protein PerM [Corynebacterium casei]|uniref:cell division protein PerM n=1 Tax=Corynebacterium casei TaxID=160386 RepID=UPI003FCF4CC8